MTTSVKEIVFIGVSLLARLRKNYSTDYHIIWWKGGTRAMEEAIRFW